MDFTSKKEVETTLNHFHQDAFPDVFKKKTTEALWETMNSKNDYYWT